MIDLMHYDLGPDDREPDDADTVTVRAIRKYIALTIDGLDNPAHIIVDDESGENRWYSPDSGYHGYWYVDGPVLDIVIERK